MKFLSRALFLLFILVGSSLLGAVVTRLYAIETNGVSLETMEENQ